jgi:large subunit ribosomal protein L22
MQTETREFRAEARFQRVSPQKARLVLDLIKGRGVEEALNTVAFTKKAVAPLVEKVLRSALQNANHLSQEQGLDVDLDNLYVKTAVANEGPRMKRIRPAPMGRAYRYQRRLSHIAIAVAERAQADGLVQRVGEESAEPVVKQAKKSAGRKSPAKKTAKKAAHKAAHKPAHHPAKKAAKKKSAKKK